MAIHAIIRCNRDFMLLLESESVLASGGAQQQTMAKHLFLIKMGK